jgi:hypothetical protein
LVGKQKSITTKMKLRIPIIASAILMTGILSGFQKNQLPRFLKGNMHTHSFWSDGNTYPEEVARWYRDHGYQFLAITDHNLLQKGIRYRVSGKDSVRLKELSELRTEFDKKDEFMLLQAEEITDGAEKKPVHLNGFNLGTVVNPVRAATVKETLDTDVINIREALAGTPNPEWISVNHPNFGWGLTASDLAECGARFFEVFNGHPSVRNYGDSAHPGTETMWDEANKWRVDRNEDMLLGTATDDAHQYDKYSVGNANPGRGWVMVRAEALTPEALYQSMMKGDFYATTGVELIDFSKHKNTLTIKIKAVKGVKYKTEFIGWVHGQDHPDILATVEGPKAVYKASGNELFVRARITSDKSKANAYVNGDFEMAWVQPVTLR